MSSHESDSGSEWSLRLLNVRRRLRLDQQQMGDRLGVTREWVSRLENARGAFSNEVKRGIVDAERELTDHNSAVAEEPSDYRKPGVAQPGTAERLREEILTYVELTVAAAGDDVGKLGYLRETLKIHFAPPPHWRARGAITDEEHIQALQHVLAEENKRKREQQTHSSSAITQEGAGR